MSVKYHSLQSYHRKCAVREHGAFQRNPIHQQIGFFLSLPYYKDKGQRTMATLQGQNLTFSSMNAPNSGQNV